MSRELNRAGFPYLIVSLRLCWPDCIELKDVSEMKCVGSIHLVDDAMPVEHSTAGSVFPQCSNIACMSRSSDIHSHYRMTGKYRGNACL
jgi:hypothetical protein